MKTMITIILLLMMGWPTVSHAQQAPTGKTTIVGGVLVDLYGSYWIYREPLQGELPIRVAVEYLDENDKPTMYAYKLKTDENGYFKIENAPAGKYILKAIELHVGQSVHITAASEYGRWQKGEKYRFWGMLSGMMYRNERYLIETIFENEPASGVVDVGITSLSIRIDERMGGGLNNYSPNGMPPWVRMSLRQGIDRSVDFIIEYENYAEISDLKMEEKDVTMNMVTPREYFKLE